MYSFVQIPFIYVQNISLRKLPFTKRTLSLGKLYRQSVIDLSRGGGGTHVLDATGVWARQGYLFHNFMKGRGIQKTEELKSRRAKNEAHTRGLSKSSHFAEQNRYGIIAFYVNFKKASWNCLIYGWNGPETSYKWHCAANGRGVFFKEMRMEGGWGVRPHTHTFLDPVP